MSDIFKQLLHGKIDPRFLPDELDLNEFISQVEVPEELPIEQRKTTSVSRDSLGAGDVFPDLVTEAPLSEEQANQVDARIADLKQRLGASVVRIRRVKADIVQQATNVEGTNTEFSVSFNISKRPRLRRIIKKVFGKKSKEITFSMYQEALEAKRALEQEQINEYTQPDSEEFDEEDE